MSAPPATPRPSFGWWVLAAAALLALVSPTTLAGVAPEPTADQLRLGAWVLKGALVLFAVGVVALERVCARDVARRPAATAASLPWERGERLALAGLLVLALALRLVRLDGGLWIDEISTLLTYVRRPMVETFVVYDSQNQHPLYTLLAQLSIAAFGDSPSALRLPAVLLGVASIAAFHPLARRVASREEALLGAALLTVSMHHVWFSQNARGYTGLLALSLVATHALWRLVRREGSVRRWAWVYAVSMGLATWVHLTGALIAVGHALVLLVVMAAPGIVGVARGAASRDVVLPGLAAIAMAALVSILLYAPVLPQLPDAILNAPPTVPVAPGRGPASIVWKNPLWFATEMLARLAAGVPGGMPTVVVALGVLAAGVWSYVREQRLLLALIVVPMATTIGIMMATRHNLWPRFFFFAAGFAVMLAMRGGFALVSWVGGGLARLGDATVRRVAVAGASLVVAASALSVPRAWGPKQDFAGAADFLRRSQGPGDAIVTLGVTDEPIRKYLGVATDSLDRLEELQAVEAAHARTWVVVTFPVLFEARQPDVADWLRGRYDTAAVFTGSVGGGNVVVLVRDKSRA
ncbi:MAG TPA: glycosyltransferase family 39 protein [Gemmatimonadaceae bacterium]|nr:glycosyltransferase family 39 protein [Gemmatimonadaceae bacterium]